MGAAVTVWSKAAFALGLYSGCLLRDESISGSDSFNPSFGFSAIYWARGFDSGLTTGVNMLGVFLAFSIFFSTAFSIAPSGIIFPSIFGLKPLSSPAFFIASSFEETSSDSITKGSNAATVRPLNPST